MAKDFEAHGEGVIRVVRVEKPDVYLRCIASIIPKEFAVTDAKIGELGDEEIASLLATVRELKEKAQAEAANDESIH
jgi:2,3-bisphosphoglycerate-independent phosphoglycerate mutase